MPQVYGAFAGLFQGLQQGLQTLLALKEAERERADRDRREKEEAAFRERQLGLAERQVELAEEAPMRTGWLAETARGLRVPYSQFKLEMEAPRVSYPAQTLALPGGGTMPLPARPSFDQEIGTARSRMLQQALRGESPQAQPISGGVVEPSEAMMLELLRSSERQKSDTTAWTPITPGEAGTPRLERHPVTGQTRVMRDPQGKPLLWPVEKIERGYLNITGAIERAGDANRALPAMLTAETLEKTDPNIGGRVMRKMNTLLGSIPKFRQQLADDPSVRSHLFQLLEPDEQAYWTAINQFYAGLARGEIGAAQTLQERINLLSAWFPLGEVKDPALIQEYQQRRFDEIQKAIHGSAGAFRDLYAPVLQRRGIDLSRFVIDYPPVWDEPHSEPNTASQKPQTLDEIERLLGIPR